MFDKIVKSFKEETSRDKAWLGLVFIYQNIILVLYWIFHDNQEFITGLQKTLPYDTLFLVMEILFLLFGLTYMLSVRHLFKRRINHV